jgi:predicted alpha/beta-fold hydrolase
MAEVMGLLKQIPFEMRMAPTLAAVLCGLLDAMPRILNSIKVTAGLVYAYPGVFEPVMLESDDGTPLCGLLALQPGDSKKPALVIAHGFFNSKNSFGMLSLARRAYFEWGFNVLALDLRDAGDSSRFSEAPLSWGCRESEDIAAAVDYLSATGRVSTTGVCGFGMGGSSAILAACRTESDRRLSGGVVSLNGYADARRFVNDIATVPGPSPAAFLRWLSLKLFLTVKTLAGGPRPFSDPRAYTREVASQYYELSEQDLYAGASPARCIADMEVPCLVTHSLDDPVTAVDEAYDLLAAAADNPLVDSLVVPSGAHVLYSLVCPSWFYQTLRTFFTYWGEFNPNPAHYVRHPGNDILGNLEN